MEIPSARGGRRPAEPLLVEFVRELTAEDLESLATPVPLGAKPPTVQELRASHHALAQLLAKGLSATEAGQITGYSASRISILKNQDPAFAELVEYYRAKREVVFVDALERMKAVGLDTLELLHERVLNDPDALSVREMGEMVELLLVKPTRGQGAAGPLGPTAPGNGVTVNVKFVSADPHPNLTIDGEIS